MEGGLDREKTQGVVSLTVVVRESTGSNMDLSVRTEEGNETLKDLRIIYTLDVMLVGNVLKRKSRILLECSIHDYHRGKTGVKMRVERLIFSL